MIKTVIFDKDGVLLDLAATWLPIATLMTRLLDEHTKGRFGAPFFQSIIGIDSDAGTIDHGGLFAAGSFADQRDAIVAKVPELHDVMQVGTEFHARMRKAVDINHERPVQAKGPVKDTLRRLRNDGYHLAVLTNDSEVSARTSCKQLQVHDLFDTIIGFDSGFGGKPDPQGFLAICDSLSTKPDETIMVGDTMADIGVAEAAGARHFIGISASYPEPTPPLKNVRHIMADISGLPALLPTLD